MDQLKRLVWGLGEQPSGLLPPQEYQLDLEAYMTVITGCIQLVLVYIRLLHMSHVSSMFYVKYTWGICYTWTWLEAHRWSCYRGLYSCVYGLYWSILGYFICNMSQICYMSGTQGASGAHGPALEAYMTVITACIRLLLVYIRLLLMHHVAHMLRISYMWCTWYTWTWFLEANGPALKALWR